MFLLCECWGVHFFVLFICLFVFNPGFVYIMYYDYVYNYSTYYVYCANIYYMYTIVFSLKALNNIVFKEYNEVT